MEEEESRQFLIFDHRIKKQNDSEKNDEKLQEFFSEFMYCEPSEAEEFLSIKQLIARVQNFIGYEIAADELIAWLDTNLMKPITCEGEFLYPISPRPFD